MKRFVVFYGLPGSGKTTAALKLQREYLDQGVDSLRVNQDDIRRTLGWKSWATWDFTSDLEKSVYGTKDRLLREAFEAGIPVVVSDDTNLDRKRRQAMQELASQHGYETSVVYVETPPEECVKRDALRGIYSVGRTVIEKMAARFPDLYPRPAIDYSRFQIYIPTASMPAVICDLDGTLSLFQGKRSPYDASTCDQDDVNYGVREALRGASARFAQVIYLSGRYNKYRPQTIDFLTRHSCPQGILYMRADDDKRADWIVKGELFDKHVRDRYNVLFVLDDRNQVVNMWRAIGLTCFQVAPGDF